MNMLKKIIEQMDLEYLIKKANGRKMVIWGASLTGKRVFELLLEKENLIYAFVDKKAKDMNFKLDSIEIKDPEILISGKEEFYVIITTNYYEEIEKFLMDNQFKEIEDYFYIIHKPIEVEACEEYTDLYGNTIKGKVNNLIVEFTGWNNKIEIKSNCKFGERSKIYCNCNTTIEIEANCEFGVKSVFVASESVIKIKASCSFSNDVDIRAAYNSKIIIGEGCTLGARNLVVSAYKGKVIIGDKCMIARDVSIINNDGHPIFDVKTGSQTNTNKQINIGNHVWIGIKSTVISGSKIGDGSIIGANSLVNKEFPNNCTIAGNPASLRNKDIAWDRSEVDYSLINKDLYWSMTIE